MSTLLRDLSEALDHIATAMDVAMPTGTTVLRVGGGFAGNEIRRHVTQAPAVMIALLGATDYTRRGADVWAMRARFAAYILTRDQAGAEPRDMSALTLVTAVVRASSRSVWGRPEAFQPEKESVQATNLYSGALDAVAVALWAVTWEQGLLLAPAT